MAIGIDIIKTSRMQQFLERFEKKALLRFLCDSEILLVKNYKTAAGFWAVKEAFSKALGTGIGKECSFHDIQIYKTKSGAPKLALSKKLVNQFSIKSSAISITHDGDYAIGAVTIELSTTDEIKQF